ncbi:hypothetical protein ABT354_29280 [Streptomyces sp. NPDC000594]|uniref:hypothetical protein n=1 Tax=Streptomyces sp. NPDC000594 TaxID=3154261 RepID=UPI0033185EE1
MRVTRAIVGLATAGAAVLGTAPATAAPAGAVEAGVWGHYGDVDPITVSSSLWRCGDSRTITTGVIGRVCAVRAANGTGIGVHTAVIVRNNRSTSFLAQADASMWRSGVNMGHWICSAEWVEASTWSVCIGLTRHDAHSVSAKGWLNGWSVGSSPTV